MKKSSLHMLLIALVTIITFANTIPHPFVYDDHFFLENNYDIRSLENIPSYFTKASIGQLYRPLRSTGYAVIYAISKGNPVGFHINAIILHSIAAILVYLIVSKIKSNVALPVALLFAVHPAQTSRISNLTASFDIIGIVFALVSFYYYITRKNKKHILISITAYILALLASEEAILLPAFFLLYDWTQKKSIKSNLKLYAAYILPLIFYLIVRTNILGQAGRADVYYMGDLPTRILSTLVIFLRYIGVLLWPTNLSVRYDIQTYSTLAWPVIAAIIVIGSLVYLYFKQLKSSPNYSFAIGWFFLGLIPFSNILPVHSFMQSRYLYLPSIGFIFGITCLLYNIVKQKKARLAIIAILLITLSVLSIQRNEEWSSDLSLLASAVKKQPNSSDAHQELAQVYEEMGATDNALEEYEKAIQLNSKNHIAYVNLGSLLAELGRPDDALYYIGESLKIHETYKGYTNLGILLHQLGSSNEAIDILNKAIEFDPTLSKAYMDLAIVYAQVGNNADANLNFQKAITINPNNPDYHLNYAVFLDFIDDKTNANKHRVIARQLTNDP